MKFVIFVVAALIAAAAAETYDEFSERMALKTNRMQKEWKAGYNSFLRGWDMERIKTLMGTKMGYVEGTPIKDVEVKDTLPATFDAREKWSFCDSISHIRDQATCGSCWAVSAAEVATDRHCIQSNGNNKPVISSEDLLECCSICGYGCQGGWPIKAMQFWKSPGIVTGGDYGSNVGCQPYEIAPCTHNCQESATPRCSKPSCIAGYSTKYQADKQQAKSYYNVPANVDKIRQEIFTNGPVVAAFDVYQDFMNYKSGIYHHVTGGYLGGHAVKIIGWGTESGTDYWLVANQWNTTWGDNGYFKMRRGHNDCGFEAGVVAGMADE